MACSTRIHMPQSGYNEFLVRSHITSPSYPLLFAQNVQYSRRETATLKSPASFLPLKQLLSLLCLFQHPNKS